MKAAPLLALSLLFACAGRPAPRVVPAVVEWHVGIGEKDGPEPMIETILPATYRGKSVWRVVHRDADPARDGAHNSYDMYDVDPEALVPIRSIMAREGFYLGLTFDGDRVEIEKREGDRRQETEVRVDRPMPEGPGLKVLLASLPLRPGYSTTFPIVDRWAKDEASRVQSIDLTVSGPQTIQTAMGRCEVLEVVLAPRDRSFQIREWVRAAPPYYPVRTEYTRGELRLVSEVVRMLIAGLGDGC